MLFTDAETAAGWTIPSMATLFTGLHPEALQATKQLVACIHPGWQALHGRERVMASWRALLGAGAAPDIRCEDPKLIMLDHTAVVTCVECIGATQLVATNIFVLEDGIGKMIHHHAAPFMTRMLPTEATPPPTAIN